MHAKSLQLCPTLCDPMDCSPPGFYVHGIFQQEYWSEVLSPSSGYRLHLRTETTTPWAGGFSNTEPPRKPNFYYIYPIPGEHHEKYFLTALIRCHNCRDCTHNDVVHACPAIKRAPLPLSTGVTIAETLDKDLFTITTLQ